MKALCRFKDSLTVPEFVAALILNASDACWKAGLKLAVEAVCLMAEHVGAYSNTGPLTVPASRSHDFHKVIDRGLFQQAWDLLANKTLASVDDALRHVGLDARSISTTFFEARTVLQALRLPRHVQHTACRNFGAAISSDAPTLLRERTPTRRPDIRSQVARQLKRN